jgi:hypothetical protein
VGHIECRQFSISAILETAIFRVNDLGRGFGSRNTVLALHSVLEVKQELSKPPPKVINPEDGDYNICRNIRKSSIFNAA